ncbi:MAG TPA: hypothetical protein PLC48_13475 [Ferruginibacter sp.]|nr:hypothetical protein [Ferruginibacter sp.]
MQEENFSPQDSIKLIQSMIVKTRSDMGANAIYFIVWGWITFLACTGQFVLKNLLNYPKHYQVWLLVIPGVLISIYLGIKEKKARTVNTYIGESMKYLWTGMGISFFVLSMIFTRMGWNSNIFPFFIMLYGLGTFISGRLLQFNPLVIGGLIAFALAILSTFFNYDYQMLFGAAAILFSYLIPAYLLRRKNRSLKIA